MAEEGGHKSPVTEPVTIPHQATTNGAKPADSNTNLPPLDLPPGCSDSLFHPYDDMNDIRYTPQSNPLSNPVDTIETANPNDLLVPGLSLPSKPNTGNGKGAIEKREGRC